MILTHREQRKNYFHLLLSDCANELQRIYFKPSREVWWFKEGYIFKTWHIFEDQLIILFHFRSLWKFVEEQAEKSLENFMNWKSQIKKNPVKIVLILFIKVWQKFAV